MQRQLKDFFIPHEGNGYTPHSLQKMAVFGMLILILLSFTLANLQSILWVSSNWLVSTILPAVIVELTNEERSGEQVGNLQRNAVLDYAATLKAQHMAENQYFAHYSPTGVSPWYWFNQADYNFVHAGENLAIHFSDSGAVVDAWMNSPTHRANIVNGNFTEIGVGTAQGVYEGFNTVYVVQLFGTPAASAAPAPVVASIPEPEPTVLAETQTEGEEPVSAQIAGAEDVIEEIDDTTIELSAVRDPVVTAADTEEDREEYVETTIAEVVADTETISVYSELVSTSTGGIPATIDRTSAGSTGESTPAIYKVATQPQTVLQVLYLVISLFVLGALMLSIVIEIERQQPLQIAYSAALLIIMVGLFYAHSVVVSGVTIV